MNRVIQAGIVESVANDMISKLSINPHITHNPESSHHWAVGRLFGSNSPQANQGDPLASAQGLNQAAHYRETRDFPDVWTDLVHLILMGAPIGCP